MKTYRTILSFVVLSLLSSCITLKDLELKEVKGFQIHKLDMQGMDSEVMLSINNPNGFGFKLYPSEFDIQYSGVYLGKAILQNTTHIRKKETATYNFLLKNDFRNINVLEVLSLLKPGAYKNEIKIRGDLKTGYFLFRKNFKIDHSEKIGITSPGT